MRKELSRIPILKGKVYCSAKCGMGCTKANYDRAVKDSAALAKRMGAGWKPRVWENLGWHYAVDKGRPQDVFSDGFLEITTHGDIYTAWIQTTPQFIRHHKDPKTALRLAVKDFDTHLSQLNKLRNLVDRTLKQEN